MCRLCEGLDYDYSDDAAGTSPKLSGANDSNSPKISKYAPKHKLLATNLKEEKAKFFASTTYNPQFTYRIGSQTIENMLKHANNKQETKLLAEALGIMKVAVEKYGRGNVLKSKDPIEGSEDDRQLSLAEATVMLNDFLKKSRVDHHCNIQWADMHNSGTFINRKSVSYARFKCKDEYFDKSSNSCKHTLYVSINLDRNPIRLKSFAVHEIGTHLVRRVNEEVQPWCFGRSNFKLRKPGETRADIQTEEGFATINDTLVTPGQLLTQHAVTYFVSAHAKSCSFREIFDMLEPFVSDKDVRWKFCVNAKRGMQDASQPGGDGKAQAYFEGAVEILKNIVDIDIPLLFCGKIALDEHDRVKRVVRREGLTLPPFCQDIQAYRYELLNMAFINKLITSIPYGYKPAPLVRKPRVRNPLYHYAPTTRSRQIHSNEVTDSARVPVGSPMNAIKANRRPSTASTIDKVKAPDQIQDFRQIQAYERDARRKRQEERDRIKEEKLRKRQEQLERDNERKMKKMYGSKYKRKKNRQKIKASKNRKKCKKRQSKKIYKCRSDEDDTDDTVSNPSDSSEDLSDVQEQKTHVPPKHKKIVSDLTKPNNTNGTEQSNKNKKKKITCTTRKPLYHVPQKGNLTPLQQDVQFSIQDLQRMYPTMKFSEAPSAASLEDLPLVTSAMKR